jgi:hypothetical protein
MKESPDREAAQLEALARRYLDLWQDQVAAMAADPELSDTLARLWQTTAAAGPAGWAALWGMGRPPAAGAGPETPASPAAASGPGGARPAAGAPQAAAHEPQAGAAAAAAASRQRPDDVAELARRMAELEVRLGRIEAALAVAGHDERRGARPRRRARRGPAGGG